MYSSRSIDVSLKTSQCSFNQLFTVLTTGLHIWTSVCRSELSELSSDQRKPELQGKLYSCVQTAHMPVEEYTLQQDWMSWNPTEWNCLFFWSGKQNLSSTMASLHDPSLTYKYIPPLFDFPAASVSWFALWNWNPPSYSTSSGADSLSLVSAKQKAAQRGKTHFCLNSSILLLKKHRFARKMLEKGVRKPCSRRLTSVPDHFLQVLLNPSVARMSKKSREYEKSSFVCVGNEMSLWDGLSEKWPYWKSCKHWLRKKTPQLASAAPCYLT